MQICFRTFRSSVLRHRCAAGEPLSLSLVCTMLGLMCARMCVDVVGFHKGLLLGEYSWQFSANSKPLRHPEGSSVRSVVVVVVFVCIYTDVGTLYAQHICALNRTSFTPPLRHPSKSPMMIVVRVVALRLVQCTATNQHHQHSAPHLPPVHGEHTDIILFGKYAYRNAVAIALHCCLHMCKVCACKWRTTWNDALGFRAVCIYMCASACESCLRLFSIVVFVHTLQLLRRCIAVSAGCSCTSVQKLSECVCLCECRSGLRITLADCW